MDKPSLILGEATTENHQHTGAGQNIPSLTVTFPESEEGGQEWKATGDSLSQQVLESGRSTRHAFGLQGTTSPPARAPQP